MVATAVSVEVAVVMVMEVYGQINAIPFIVLSISLCHRAFIRCDGVCVCVCFELVIGCWHRHHYLSNDFYRVNYFVSIILFCVYYTSTFASCAHSCFPAIRIFANPTQSQHITAATANALCDRVHGQHATVGKHFHK